MLVLRKTIIEIFNEKCEINITDDSGAIITGYLKVIPSTNIFFKFQLKLYFNVNMLSLSPHLPRIFNNMLATDV